MDMGEPAEGTGPHDDVTPSVDGWLGRLWQKLLESREVANELNVAVEAKIAELERLIEDALKAADHEE